MLLCAMISLRAHIANITLFAASTDDHALLIGKLEMKALKSKFERVKHWSRSFGKA
jgi:hypothetical protein